MLKLFLASLVLGCVYAQRTPPPRAPPSEKYSLFRLPHDVRPVWYLVGRWENMSPQNGVLRTPMLPFGDYLDFGVGILPMFGSRSLNYTGHVWDSSGRTIFSEYGYLLVKNVTRRDPTMRAAFLTVTDKGYTTLEEGQVNGNTVTLDMQSFGERSFNVDRFRNAASIRRVFEFRNDVLTQKLDYNINGERRQETIQYRKVAGWPCSQGCNHGPSVDACSLCS